MDYQVEYDSKGLNSRKIWWHDNGKKSKMITFKNGKIDGIWITCPMKVEKPEKGFTRMDLWSVSVFIRVNTFRRINF